MNKARKRENSLTVEQKRRHIAEQRVEKQEEEKGETQERKKEVGDGKVENVFI